MWHLCRCLAHHRALVLKRTVDVKTANCYLKKYIAQKLHFLCIWFSWGFGDFVEPDRVGVKKPKTTAVDIAVCCLECIPNGRTIFKIIVIHYLFFLNCGLNTMCQETQPFMYTGIFQADPALFIQMLWSWDSACMEPTRVLLWGAFARSLAGETAYTDSCLFHRSKNSLCVCTIQYFPSLSQLHLA